MCTSCSPTQDEDGQKEGDQEEEDSSHLEAVDSMHLEAVPSYTEVTFELTGINSSELHLTAPKDEVEVAQSGADTEIKPIDDVDVTHGGVDKGGASPSAEQSGITPTEQPPGKAGVPRSGELTITKVVEYVKPAPVSQGPASVSKAPAPASKLPVPVSAKPVRASKVQTVKTFVKELFFRSKKPIPPLEPEIELTPKIPTPRPPTPPVSRAPTLHKSETISSRSSAEISDSWNQSWSRRRSTKGLTPLFSNPLPVMDESYVGETPGVIQLFENPLPVYHRASVTSISGPERRKSLSPPLPLDKKTH